MKRRLLGVAVFSCAIDFSLVTPALSRGLSAGADTRYHRPLDPGPSDRVQGRAGMTRETGLATETGPLRVGTGHPAAAEAGGRPLPSGFQPKADDRPYSPR